MTCICLFLAFLPLMLFQQRTGHMPVPPLPAQQMPESRAAKPGTAEFARQQELAQEQKEKLLRNADQLSAMTAELKQMLNKTPAGTLSMDALHKSEDIEKLAKKMKKEMQGK